MKPFRVAPKEVTGDWVSHISDSDHTTLSIAVEGHGIGNTVFIRSVIHRREGIEERNQERNIDTNYQNQIKEYTPQKKKFAEK